MELWWQIHDWFYYTFVEMWQHSFMVRGFAVTLIAALVCAFLSCWLVLVGWSLMGDALSHAVMPGIVIAYLFKIPFSLGALVASLLCVGLIGLVRQNPRIKQDAAIGVVFTTFFALGITLVSIYPTNVSMGHILFGDMLGITRADMWQVFILAPIALAILWWKRKDITLYAFDPAHVVAIGLNARRLSALLLACLALTVVIAMQAVGAILIVALLITPGAAARLCSNQIAKMQLIAMLFSFIAVVAGVYISYWFDTASGATVVATQGMLFLLLYIFAPQGLRTIRKAAVKPGVEL